MDAITKASEAHGDIFESLQLYGELQYCFTHTDFDKFKNFCKVHIPEHFAFEEKHIFPVVLEKGTQKQKEMVQELHDQHEHMRLMIHALDKILSTFGLPLPEDQLNKFKELKIKLISMLFDHAHKEDNELYPLVKNMTASES